MASRDYCGIARQYAADVLGGKIPACKWEPSISGQLYPLAGRNLPAKNVGGVLPGDPAIVSRSHRIRPAPLLLHQPSHARARQA